MIWHKIREAKAHTSTFEIAMYYAPLQSFYLSVSNAINASLIKACSACTLSSPIK